MIDSKYILAIEAAVKAGKEIMHIYDSSAEVEVSSKEDHSPLTNADIASNDVINATLASLEIPILSEENTDIPFPIRSSWKELWVVDPLDGTKEFIKRNGEFTVNIALVKDNRPVFGVIYLPVFRELYVGQVDLNKAWKLNLNEDHFFAADLIKQASTIMPELPDSQEIKVVGSRSHMNDETKNFIAQLSNQHKSVEIVSKGSSLKFCVVAEGKAHVYPRYAPTMEWDTAAGQAICEAVGLEVVDKENLQTLNYNKENLLNSHFLVRHKC